jgi:His-Xaa-Ser repeat protein HxsA
MKGTKKPGRFLIPSLLAAGFTAHDPAAATDLPASTSGGNDPNTGDMLRPFTQDHLVTLASHASHSSHSSHASHSSGGYSSGPGHSSHMSHTSHRSSATYEPYDDADYTTLPPPLPVPPPPPPPAPRAPSPTGTNPLFGSPPSSSHASPPADGKLPALSGRSERFAAVVRRVQIALLAQGFYSGPLDGIVGPVLRKSLRAFQASRRLDVTGTITPQTLDALHVSSD